jgi:photosystem II stability/assembly factor-like uncharacterized protein
MIQSGWLLSCGVAVLITNAMAVNFTAITPAGNFDASTQSTDGNALWADVAMSNDGTTMISGSDYGCVWTTANSGTTWTKHASLPCSAQWFAVATSGDGTKMVAMSQGNPSGIWTSTNSGTNWTKRMDSGVWKDVVASDDFTKLVAVEPFNANIWRSTDSGATWTENTANGNGKYWWSVAGSDDLTKVYATSVVGSSPSDYSSQPVNIWRSTDSGDTWTEVTSIGTAQKWRSVTSSSDGDKLAAVVKDGNIWTSTDSGATWTEDTSIGATKTWRSVSSSSDGTKLVAAVYNGNLWRSTDSGTTWTEDTSVGTTLYWRATASSDDGSKQAASAYQSGQIGQIYLRAGPTEAATSSASSSSPLTVVGFVLMAVAIIVVISLGIMMSGLASFGSSVVSKPTEVAIPEPKV